MASSAPRLPSPVKMPGAVDGRALDEYGADRANNENHAFPQRNNVQVYAATVVALRSLGDEDESVQADPAHGTIKTAPKLLNTDAYGGQHSATAIDNTLASSIGIRPGAGAAVMFAEPRVYRGGRALTLDHVNGRVLEPQFRTWYGEIDPNF